MSDNPMTLGGLISALRWYEELQAKQASYCGAVLFHSAEAQSRIETYNDLMRVSGDIHGAPGRDRIQLLCEELDSSGDLTAANVVKLRARVCRLLTPASITLPVRLPPRLRHH